MGRCLNAMKIHWQNQVGGVVGYTRLGVDYWRSLANHVADANSISQQFYREKLKVFSKFTHSLARVWRKGFKFLKGDGRSAYNVFSKANINECMSGDLESGFVIDYAKLTVAKGGLRGLSSVTASVVAASHEVAVSWSDNTGVSEDALATDSVNVLILNITKGENVFMANVATRMEEACSVEYPAEWTGDTVYVFLFMSNEVQNSDSQLLGFYTA